MISCKVPYTNVILHKVPFANVAFRGDNVGADVVFEAKVEHQRPHALAVHPLG